MNFIFVDTNFILKENFKELNIINSIEDLYSENFKKLIKLDKKKICKIIILPTVISELVGVSKKFSRQTLNIMNLRNSINESDYIVINKIWDFPYEKFIWLINGKLDFFDQGNNNKSYIMSNDFLLFWEMIWVYLDISRSGHSQKIYFLTHDKKYKKMIKKLGFENLISTCEKIKNDLKEYPDEKWGLVSSPNKIFIEKKLHLLTERYNNLQLKPVNKIHNLEKQKNIVDIDYSQLSATRLLENGNWVYFNISAGLKDQKTGISLIIEGIIKISNNKIMELHFLTMDNLMFYHTHKMTWSAISKILVNKLESNYDKNLIYSLYWS